MKTFIIIILFLLCAGVFGDDVKSVSVMEGDSVTLRTDLTEIKTGDLVWWRFKKGDSKDLLAEIGKNKIWYGERFKDKLLTDGKTGDLNITNMKIKYSGLYEAEINSGTGTSYKRFNVTVNESPRVNNAEMSVVKSVSVTEGESVTLQTDVKLQTDDLILWRFGDASVLIAKGDMEDNKISYIDADGSFGDRLKLNDQTGDLTITDSKSKHSGVYQLKIISTKQTLYKTFSVIVKGAGSSLGVVAGLCVFFLLVIAAIIAAGLILYRHKISKLLVPVDEQKSLVPRSEMEAEMRDDELKEVTYKGHGKSQKPQNSYEMLISVEGDEAGVAVKDEVKSGSVKGVQAVTDTVQENTQKPQNSVTYTVDKNTQKQQDSVCAAAINEEMIRTGKTGESVSLDTCVTEIQRDDEILWMYEDKTIAEYTGGTDKPTLNKTDERFKDKLEMNHQTGDLTIRNMRSELTGVYKVQIKNSSGNTERKFIVALYVRPTMGGSIMISTKVKINKGDAVEWTSEDKSILVTGMNGDDSKTSYTDDERFRGRLKMNAQTGDLTIRDIRQTDDGVYTLKLTKADGKITEYRIFNVDVTVKAQLNLQIQQKSDEQKRQSSKREAERRANEFKEADKGHGNPQKPQTSAKTQQNLQIQHNSDVPVIGESKSVSVKGDQAETDKNDENNQKHPDSAKAQENLQKPQNSDVLKVESVSVEGGDEAGTDKVDKNIQNPQNSVCAAAINEEMIRTGKTGESVSLDTCVTEIQRDDEILWMYEDMTIAQYTGDTDKPTLNKTDERFKDKLEMNHQIGDLTIRYFTSDHTGVYKVQIKNSNGNKGRKFIVALYVRPTKEKCVFMCSQFKINEGDAVEWTSEDKSTLVTGMNGDDSKTSYTDDERFKGRLFMMAQTGDLTIRNIRETDEGVYTLKLTKADGKITYRIFSVDVSEMIRTGKMGESVTLETCVNETQRDDVIGDTTSTLEDSADVSDELEMVKTPLLDKAAERSSTSSVTRSLYLPQGSQTRFDSGWTSKSFHTTRRY